MLDNQMLLLKYQDNFADNLSMLAYAKVLESKTNKRYYFENLTSKRDFFESKMTCFNMDYKYISTNKANEIAQASYFLSRLYLDEKVINKELKKNAKNSQILDLKHYRIDDIPYISNEIKDMFKFKNLEFIRNYDILEKIQNSQSIGLYLNKKDIDRKNIDFDFIYRATCRLNKYIKQPKMFIFTRNSANFNIISYIDYEIIDLKDWREEFYFLSQCKHFIVPLSDNSYSENFWASQINNRTYSINVFDKKAKTKKKYKNWIGV